MIAVVALQLALVAAPQGSPSISIAELAADPAAREGERVVICGTTAVGREATGLWDGANYVSVQWLDPADGVGAPVRKACVTGTVVAACADHKRLKLSGYCIGPNWVVRQNNELGR